MVAADDRTAITFSLSPGNDHDAPHARALLNELGPMPEGLPMLMDRAYEGNETGQLVLDPGMVPVVPAKCKRLHQWVVCKGVRQQAVTGKFRRLGRIIW